MSFHPLFREDKATQVAARFLESEGGETDVLKLVKLMYLADRSSLVRYGRPLTFDNFYLLKHGPIVSSTMDCINADPDEGLAAYWSRFISPRTQTHRVALTADPGSETLSPADEDVIRDVFQRFGHMDKWQIRDYTHDLPEYRDPGEERRIPLKYQDVLRAVGWEDEDIEAAIAALLAEVSATRVLG